MKKTPNQLGLSKSLESLISPHKEELLNSSELDSIPREENECSLVFKNSGDITVHPLSAQKWSKHPNLVYQSIIDFSTLDAIKYHRPFNVDAIHQSRLTKRFLLQEHKLGFWEESKLLNLLGERGGVAPYLRKSYREDNGICYITFNIVNGEHIPKFIILFDAHLIDSLSDSIREYVHDSVRYYYVSQSLFSWGDLVKVLKFWDELGK